MHRSAQWCARMEVCANVFKLRAFWLAKETAQITDLSVEIADIDKAVAEVPRERGCLAGGRMDFPSHAV